jgi:hypothetical protein
MSAREGFEGGMRMGRVRRGEWIGREDGRGNGEGVDLMMRVRMRRKGGDDG